MQTLVVPKNRKPKFTLAFKILDLNNIPYVSGGVLVKWHISSSTEHGDHRTHKIPIKDHRAVFDYERSTTIRMVVDKTGVLQECNLDLEVIHEVPTGGKEDRSLLGSVKINLAEYVETTRQTQDPVQRRHLLQDSKINSTLKLAIHLTQTEGEKNFLAPPLKSAPVFIGIAGVMAGEEAQHADTIEAPILDSRKRETGVELRDLYHKTLAAGLTSHYGVPDADQIIEDIFAGGDGWRGAQPTDHMDFSSMNGRRMAGSSSAGLTSDEGGAWTTDDTQNNMRTNKRSWPDFQYSKRVRGGRSDVASLRSRTSFGQVSNSDSMDKDYGGSVPELNELDVRDDLRCWNCKE